jgi:hypothetical protein
MIDAYTECPKCSEELCKFGKCHQCDTCDNHAEAAYERWLESYYGGDSPSCESATDQMSRLRREKDGVL